jgi:hypothetical protein
MAGLLTDTPIKMQYDEHIRYERIIKYSIAFHKKTCEVVMKKTGNNQ